jgi:hypothetical protein
MKNVFDRTKSDSEHLKDLGASVMITNACNLACGGCSVLCGTFPKEKLWFISPEQLRIDIEAAGLHNWHITLYGGEPTAHPKLEELLDICEKEFPQFGFQVFTNGFKPFRERPNVGTRLDEKKKGFNRPFVSTLIAPQDMLKVKDPDFYWQSARSRCGIFNGCNAQIYNGKAYICQVAAGMDHLRTGGENGWEVIPGQDPFDRTDEEIAEQGRKFCPSCAHCLGGEHLHMQESKDPHVASESNIVFITPKHKPTLADKKTPKLDPELRREMAKYIKLF